MDWKMWPRVSFHWHSEFSTLRKSSCLLGRCFLWDYRTNIFQRLIIVSHLIICCCNYQVCSFDSNFQYKFVTVFSFKKTQPTNQKNLPYKKNPQKNLIKKQRKQCSLKQKLHTAYREQKRRRKGTIEILVPVLVLEVCQDLKSTVNLSQRGKFSQDKLQKKAQMANRRVLNSGLHRGGRF